MALGLALVGAGVLGACSKDDAPAVALSAAGKRGKAVADEKGCGACHTTSGSRSTGPTWKDLAGSKVELTNGKTVTADDAYLERAIREPRAEVVKGYPNIMPEAYSDLTDEQVADLLAYLRDLAG